MNFDGVKICSVPDHVGNVSCLWPFPNVAVYAEGMLGGVNMVDAVEQALAIWNGVCGINLKMAANRSVAHIVIGRGSIDGPNGTLAWSELPCGFTKSQWRQLQQKYDTGEMWTIAENPPNGKIDAVRVIAHELGHALGVQHLAMGNLMAPTYSTSIRYPQNGDIVEMLARYGKPVVPEPPAPVPTVPQPVPPVVPSVPGVPAGEKCILVDEKGNRWELNVGLRRL
jgi:predicted Zn-dependent protease